MRSSIQQTTPEISPCEVVESERFSDASPGDGSSAGPFSTLAVWYEIVRFSVLLLFNKSLPARSRTVLGESNHSRLL